MPITVARDAFVHLISLDCSLTYDRADFTYKLLRNNVQKYYVFSSLRHTWVRTHLVCLRHQNELISIQYVHNTFTGAMWRYGALQAVCFTDRTFPLWCRATHVFSATVRLYCIAYSMLVASTLATVVYFFPFVHETNLTKHRMLPEAFFSDFQYSLSGVTVRFVIFILSLKHTRTP